MDRTTSTRVGRWTAAGFLASLPLLLTGCVGILSQLIYITGGGKVPAEFDDLKEKRVAVVCVSENSFGPNTASSLLAASVNRLLAKNVKKIQIIDQQKIDDWRDNNGWDGLDYREIGRGVQADMLVAIDLYDFRLHGGQTMYQGAAEVGITVYDMTQGGKVVFQREPAAVRYPITTGVPKTEKTEIEFRNEFVVVIAQRIGRYFYPYEAFEDYARDPAF